MTYRYESNYQAIDLLVGIVLAAIFAIFAVLAH